MTDKPTAERILKAFSDISLTIIKNAAGEDILRRLTPLSGVQEDILQRLGLGAALYRQLEIQAIGTLMGRMGSCTANGELLFSSTCKTDDISESTARQGGCTTSRLSAEV